MSVGVRINLQDRRQFGDRAPKILGLDLGAAEARSGAPRVVLGSSESTAIALEAKPAAPASRGNMKYNAEIRMTIVLSSSQNFLSALAQGGVETVEKFGADRLVVGDGEIELGSHRIDEHAALE